MPLILIVFLFLFYFVLFYFCFVLLYFILYYILSSLLLLLFCIFFLVSSGLLGAAKLPSISVATRWAHPYQLGCRVWRARPFGAGGLPRATLW
jgi:hypothetical protein